MCDACTMRIALRESSVLAVSLILLTAWGCGGAEPEPGPAAEEVTEAVTEPAHGPAHEPAHEPRAVPLDGRKGVAKDLAVGAPRRTGELPAKTWSGLVRVSAVEASAPEEPEPERIQASSLPTAELLEYLSGPDMWVRLTADDGPFGGGKWELIQALSDRSEDFEEMLRFFHACTYSAGQDALLFVFMGLGDTAMDHPDLVDHVPTGLYSGSFHWVIRRAEEGHAGCLDQLAANFWDYAAPSRDRAELTVFLAEQGRREMIPSFVDWITAADLSLAGSCVTALKIFYPESDPPMDGPGVAQDYYVEYASSEFPELAE